MIYFSNATGTDNPCYTNERLCLDNSNCVKINHICDGKADCSDSSDEELCTCKHRLNRERWCDGYMDCPDGDDEKECSGNVE